MKPQYREYLVSVELAAEILGTVPVPIAYLSADLVYLQCNEAAAASLGMRAEEVVGRRLDEIVGEDSDTYRAVSHVLETGERSSRIVEVGSPDRQAAPAYHVVSYVPRKDESGRVLGVFAEELDISEQMRGQRELVRRLAGEREQLKAVLASMTEGVVISDADANVLDMNAEALRLSGFDDVEQARRHVSRFVEFELRTLDGRTLPVEQWPLTRVTRGERIRDLVLEAVRRNAGGPEEVRVISYSGSPVYEDGALTRTVLTMRDVTEGLRAEEEREAAKRRLQQELETTRLLLKAADALADWTDLNKLLRGLTSVVVESTPHTRAFFYLWDEARRELTQMTSEGTQPFPTGTTFSFEAVSATTRRVIRRRRTELVDFDALPEDQRGTALAKARSHLLLVVPVVFRGGLVGLIGVDDPDERREFDAREIDLVEGIAAEASVAIQNARLFEELRQTEIKFRATFNSAAAGMALGDLTGAIVETNPALEAMLGYSEEEGLGRPISDFAVPEDAARDEVLLREMLEGKRDAYRMEKRYMRKDGELLWGDMAASIVRDDDGKPLFTLGVVEDVTERKRTEEVLREKDAGIRRAYSDVIDAVTGGRLVLVTPDEVSQALGRVVGEALAFGEPRELSAVRAEARRLLESLGKPLRDLDAFILAVGEATTNAVKHASGGRCAVRETDTAAQVVVTDDGPGLDFKSLPKATLVPGFSTKPSLGMGFTIMLDACDRLLLATEPGLTCLVLEMGFARAEGGPEA